MIVAEEYLEEYKYCWVFYYNAKASVLANWFAAQYGLTGNVQIMIDKETKELFQLSYHTDNTEQIMDYENYREGKEHTVDWNNRKINYR